MRLMLTIAYVMLGEKGEASFTQIFDAVKKEQKKYWQESFPNMSIEKIEERKQGELFTYLTTDGRFVMKDNNNWALVKAFPFNEIKKMRIHIGENTKKDSSTK